MNSKILLMKKRKIMISANKDNESEDKKKITIGSDKLEDMLNDNFIKKNSDINIYNDYEKKDKKGKESDYLTESSFFKSEENRGKSSKNANKKEIKFPFKPQIDKKIPKYKTTKINKSETKLNKREKEEDRRRGQRQYEEMQKELKREEQERYLKEYIKMGKEMDLGQNIIEMVILNIQVNFQMGIVNKLNR